MSISAIHVLDSQGKRLIFKDYRGDIDNKKALEVFVTQLAEEDSIRKPVWEYEGINYITIQHNNIRLLALTRNNADAAMALVTLYKILKIFQEYFDTVEEESIRDNFVIIYELLDEIVDFGYPQNTEPGLLKEYIVIEGQKLTKTIKKGLTDAITGGQFNTAHRVTKSYATNELFLDVIEKVNLLVSSKGNVLQHEIQGEVKVKAHLNGIPLLMMGFNDKFNFSRSNAATDDHSGEMVVAGVTGGLVVEDFSFHPAVDSNKVAADRVVRFVPPDGEFCLMNYRLSSRLKPLIWVVPAVQRHARSRVEYLIHVKAQFRKNAQAHDVTLRIPVPNDADSPKVNCSHGTAKYVPQHDVLEWTLPQLAGGSEHTIRAHFGLPSISSDETLEMKKPITVSYRLPTHTVSGLQVRYLNMTDSQSRQPYQAMPWIRYLTEAGEYAFRLT